MLRIEHNSGRCGDAFSVKGSNSLLSRASCML